MTHPCLWHDSSICVTWLIHMRDMTHSYVSHDSFACVTWLTYVCAMPCSHVWHVSCLTYLIHMYDMKKAWHTYKSCHTCECVMWYIWMSHVTHMDESSHIYIYIYMCDISHVWHISFICMTWLIHMILWHTKSETVYVQGDKETYCPRLNQDASTPCVACVCI